MSECNPYNQPLDILLKLLSSKCLHLQKKKFEEQINKSVIFEN